MSRKQFGALFDLTGDNIKSYESNVTPKLGKYFEMMDHFRLDPKKFKELDMELHDVTVGAKSEVDKPKEFNPSIDIDDFVTNSNKYAFVDSAPHDTAVRLCKNLLRDRDRMMSELDDCKSQIIDLQKLVISLQNKE